MYVSEPYITVVMVMTDVGSFGSPGSSGSPRLLPGVEGELK